MVAVEGGFLSRHAGGVIDTRGAAELSRRSTFARLRNALERADHSD